MHLRDDESSTCVCLRLREQCLRSEITSVARVAHVLLLRLVAGKQNFYSQYDSRYVGCDWLIKPATLIGRNASLSPMVTESPQMFCSLRSLCALKDVVYRFIGLCEL